MKTITIKIADKVVYAVMQEDSMEVTVAKVDPENVADFSTGISLGVLGDINELPVQQIIISKLAPV